MLRKIYRKTKNHYFETQISKTTNIYIACFPKSGSTYLSSLLSEVSGFKVSNPIQFVFHNEQDILEDKLKKMSKLNTVTQLHTKGTYDNIKLLKKYRIKPIILVRNIYDTLISCYDHIHNHDKKMPNGYIHKHFFKMNQSEKFDFLISVHLPWYFNFYISWLEASKTMDTLWVTYDDIFNNQIKTTKNILNFYNINKEDDEIKNAIEKIKNRNTRFNKGISGRGNILSTTQKNKIKDLANVWKIDNKVFKLIGIK